MNSISIKYSIYAVLIATIIARFWGMFFMLPQGIKLVFSVLLWFSILSFPWIYAKRNEFGKVNIFILFLLALGVLQTVRSLIVDSDINIGNKYITIIFNEYGALLFFPPLFCYLANNNKSFKYIVRGCFYLILFFCLYFIIGKNCFYILPIFIAPLYTLANKKEKNLIILAIGGALIQAFDGVRMAFVFVLISLVTLLILTFFYNKTLIKYLSIGLLVSPLLLFLPLLFSAGGEDSIFMTMQEYLQMKHVQDDILVDSRTFLYLEMAEDLNHTNSWLLGKGAYGHYYSYFFEMSKSGEGDYHYRLASEVPFLNLLLHGGIIYVLLYYSLFIIAIYRALWYGKSRFMQTIAITLSTYAFMTFVGDLNGCCWFHLVIFFYIGCCFSDHWLNMTDTELKTLSTIKNTFLL